MQFKAWWKQNDEDYQHTFYKPLFDVSKKQASKTDVHGKTAGMLTRVLLVLMSACNAVDNILSSSIVITYTISIVP